MFCLDSTDDKLGNCKATERSPCFSLPKHIYIDRVDRHPQIKILQKQTFAFLSFNKEKTHSDVYNGNHNQSNQHQQLRSLVKSRYGTSAIN